MKINGVCLAVAAALAIGGELSGQDWPQWRGPLGQGTTSARNLPPTGGSSTLEVLWKTPIPGEGVSSPIVKDGHVYLTTAYEGSERHPWDRVAYWTIIVLAVCSAGTALTQVPAALRAFAPQPAWTTALRCWTDVVVVLTVVVLAKPRWFWRFADPWSGPSLAAAELPWIESMYLRSALVLACGSLALLFIGLSGTAWLKPWLRFLTLVVTVTSCVAAGIVVSRPEWFNPAGQPWLVWLVTGGLGLFAVAGSIGWLAGGKWALLPVALGFVAAGWLFWEAPNDEFGRPLHLVNQIAYLAPALMLLGMHAVVGLAASKPTAYDTTATSWVLFTLTAALGVLLFVRSNALQPETGVVRAVLCLDATTGAERWRTPIFVASAEKRHSLNSLATPTPACDGERVYVDFGSALAALDLAGRILWLKRDAEFRDFIRYGAGSSLVLAGDRIIRYRDSEFMGHGHHLDDEFLDQPGRRPSALTAIDAMTGGEIWSVSPPFSHDSYMTPLVWTRDDRLEVVVATWKTIAGLDLRDGSVLWTHPYPMQQIVPSLAVHGDRLFVTGGNLQPFPMMSVRTPSSATPATTAWTNIKAGGNIVSPVCWKGLLFTVTHAGILCCLDADSGRIHWMKRLECRCLASLAAGDDKIYVLDQEGNLQVFAAAATESLLASHSFAENCSATMALAEGGLFVRTAGNVYRLGSGK
jgi:outer membrane protein assembly factor BamB